MIKSISFKMTSLTPSKNSFTGADFTGSTKIIPTPKKSAKKITFSIDPLSPAELITLLGTISTSGDNGPLSFCISADASLSDAFCENFWTRFSRVCGLIAIPGRARLTTNNPKDTAIKVVATYRPSVRRPIWESLDKSLRSETPLISEATINGIAIIFSALINIVPKGLIQSTTHCLAGSAGESTEVAASPSRIPMIIPIRIFQCSANPRINLSTISPMFLNRIEIDGRLRGR